VRRIRSLGKKRRKVMHCIYANRVRQLSALMGNKTPLETLESTYCAATYCGQGGSAARTKLGRRWFVRTHSHDHANQSHTREVARTVRSKPLSPSRNCSSPLGNVARTTRSWLLSPS
jgi:hypothetical protein